jgi:hypothetical protein
VLGFRENIVIATHILAQAGRMEASVEKPLGAFVKTVVKAYLKSKTTRLADIVTFCEAVGKPSFLVLLDTLSAGEAIGLLCRFDPNNAEKAKADPGWTRMRLAGLLTGEEAPETRRHKARAPHLAKVKSSRAPRSIIGETDAFSAKRRERTAPTPESNSRLPA